jgi:hypothetical protein
VFPLWPAQKISSPVFCVRCSPHTFDDGAFAGSVNSSVMVPPAWIPASDVRTTWDPAADAVHRGIYDASIIQAAGRVRPLERTAGNSSIIYVFSNVSLPFPVSEVVRWRDIKLGRLARMVAAGHVCTNAAEMKTFHFNLFGSEKAAAHARRRFAGLVSDVREATKAIVRHDPRPWVEVTYQSPGQGLRQRTAFIPAGAEIALRTAVEAKYGEVSRWRVWSFDDRSGEEFPIKGNQLFTEMGKSFPLLDAGSTLPGL